MRFIEKTVFICYRRNNAPWAISIWQNLTQMGYDVFLDFQSIMSGDFEQVITENILARAHFIILLTPSALERCNEPDDWFRREIEIALNSKRNIVPVLLEGFDFGDQATIDYLTGELENIKKYNGLHLYYEYFDAGIEKLDQFLSIPLNEVFHPVLHPVSPNTRQIVNEQNRALAEEAPVERNTFAAQEWFERAYKAEKPEEKIRLYTRAIELDSKFAFAYNNRGVIYANLKQYERAIEDYDQTIKLNPELVEAYNNRGISYAKLKQYERSIEDFDQAIKLNPEDADIYNNRGVSYDELKQHERAIEDYDQAIKLNPELAKAYYNRGNSYAELKQYERAIEDYDQAIKLNPERADIYNNRGISYANLKQYERAIEDYDQAIKLNPEGGSSYYNKACSYALQGLVIETTKWLRQALTKDAKDSCELARQDSDFDGIRGEAVFQKLLEEFCDKC